MTLLASCVLIAGCTLQSPSSSSIAGSSNESAVKGSSGGIVSDWTHQHVIFSNPGTLQDATSKGRRANWQRIVANPRYRMQLIRRNFAWSAGTVNPRVGSRQGFEASQKESSSPRIGKIKLSMPAQQESLDKDWEVQIAGGSNGSVALDMYPAKYSFSPIGDADCTNDFVVFPVSANGQSNQIGNLYGLNNLYAGTCSGTVPTTLFNYLVGTGKVQTSPVLSPDGTKVAFVESVPNGSIFHVLTLDKSGNAGCPNASPCNGTVFNSPAVPGVNNSAVDVAITMSGGVSDTRSSPFVDYSGDIAYVGDDNGNLHKFTGVFNGIPTEVTSSPWPFTVASGVILTGPVFDGGASQSIFVGGSTGFLYCVTAAGAACTVPSIQAGATILDAPLVDSTAQTVFVAANVNVTSNAALTQVTTAMGSRVTSIMGINGTDVYNGAFDNNYFTNISTGHMYFCGNLTTAATPALWRVGFSNTGAMTANDGNFLQLVRDGSTGPDNDCTPITEIFNSSQGNDYLFVGVKNNGNPTPCAQNTCILSAILPVSGFPGTGALNGLHNSTFGPNGNSGIIIDNVSGAAGASQIYFGNNQNNDAVQASQQQ
jgi:hypothetical protein